MKTNPGLRTPPRAALLALLAGVLISCQLPGCTPDPDDDPVEFQNELNNLMRLTRSPDADDREDAADDLGDMGPSARAAVPDLIRLLDDPEEDVREKAAKALGEIGPDARNAVPKLREVARSDPEEDVREEAQDALKEIGPVNLAGSPSAPSSGSSGSTPPPPPPPPSSGTASTPLTVSASAGPIQAYAANASYGEVTLNGSASGGSGAYSYQWQKLSGGNFIGSNLAKQNPTVVLTDTGQYLWQVTATDTSTGRTGQATVAVTKQASTGGATPPPPPPPPPPATGGDLDVTVQASPSTVSTGGQVTLTASATGGQPPYTYQWGVLAPEGASEPSVTGATAASASFNTTGAGDYYCACTVRDAAGKIDVASVKATAN